MRPIFINGRFVTQRVTGTQRYAHELLDQLDVLLTRSASPPSVTMLVPRSNGPLPSYRKIRLSQVGRFSGQLWEQFELPFYARGGILVTLVGGSPVLHRRNILTIHDAAVFASPQSFSRGFRLWYQFLYRRMCHKALQVLTVSHFSKAELIKHCKADPEKITVTYLGSEHALRPTPEPGVLTSNRLRPFKYVLAVSSRNPSKNLPGLLGALPYLADTDFDVAIAGQSYKKVFGELRISGDRVRDLGYVNESELRSLYEHAACFAFPSFYEGFGLPPLEALALGCPAVVANTGSMAEVFGPVAFLCDPHDSSTIAEMIRLASETPQEQREGYRAFANGFRWSECATITWSVIFQYAQD
ncbi:Glycosyl transferase, group 1 [Acidisarcina polymorpha]|uniref:Glycosyl transferase, group 1 n=1 Tax=Acidisarcina polymorpha TaxID=2211140 RepID=A0A2Z5G1H4_9BACT|nr:glycosyltransferase family 1 protein [Acidisarcina polymorpha]AXC12929.1 Glycosyl transferase, group 1 [Acidisarcina polymorpha]